MTGQAYRDGPPEPGVMHPVDEAFYKLTVIERDYERWKVDRLTAENAALRRRLDAAREAVWAAMEAGEIGLGTYNLLRRLLAEAVITPTEDGDQ